MWVFYLHHNKQTLQKCCSVKAEKFKSALFDKKRTFKYKHVLFFGSAWNVPALVSQQINSLSGLNVKEHRAASQSLRSELTQSRPSRCPQIQGRSGASSPRAAGAPGWTLQTDTDCRPPDCKEQRIYQDYQRKHHKAPHACLSRVNQWPNKEGA